MSADLTEDLFVGFDPADEPGDTLATLADKHGVPSDLDTAIERERNRRKAIEVVEAELTVRAPERLGSVSIGDVVAQAVLELEVKREHGDVGLKTGIESFDALAAPIFKPGRVIGVAASTKTGKTTLLQQWGVSFAEQGIPTLLFSFEDEGTDSAYRMIANVASGDVGAIRAGFLDADGNAQAVPETFDAAASRLAGLPLRMVNTPGTCAQIAVETRAWKRTWEGDKPAGVVIVDQLSHIVPDDAATIARLFPGHTLPPHRESLTQLLEWQVAMLQVIARKLNVMVVLACQLNDSQKESEVPTERSLRNSKGIGHKLDALVIPYRPSVLPNPSPGPGQPETVPNTDERMWLVVPIARHVGGKFKVEVEWQGAHQRVADLGTGMGSAYRAPKAVTNEQLRGMTAQAAVKAAWTRRLEVVQDEANGVLDAVPAPAPKLKAIGTLGARWALPAAKAKVDVPEQPVTGDWGGGGAGVVKPGDWF